MNPGQDRSRPPHPPPVAALASLVFGASARHDPASGPGTASHHRPAPTSQVLELDLTLARQFQRHADFPEGVRALLIDKDRKPKWSFQDLAAVPREEIESHFR